MKETIAKLVQHEPIFSIHENGSLIHNHFERHKESEGVILGDGEKPVGILMRNDFYQKIGRQFGYSLYMKRNIMQIMKLDIICVDISCDMAQFGYIAMNRNKESLYDFIIVVEREKYIGIVSIREFLLEMSRTKEREIELLNYQQQILQQANEAEKLHSIEIECKNASIKNLLDNAGQGFLSFGSDIMIKGEHSKECDEIFGSSIFNKNFLQLLKNFVEEDSLNMMQNAFENVFRDQDQKRNKIYLSILPQEIKIREADIKFEYKVIHNGTEKLVMIILTDITEIKALILKNAEDKNNVKLIIRAISCKTEITEAMNDLREFFTVRLPQLLNNSEDKKMVVPQIYRMIHTLKGDLSLNSLHNTSKELHKIEDTLAEMKENVNQISMNQISSFMNKISSDELLRKDMDIIIETLGTQYFEKDVTYEVSKERLKIIENEIRKNFKNQEKAIMLQLLDSLFYANIKDILRNYSDYTNAVAEKMGKSIGDYKITGHDVYIDRNQYTGFTKSLVHIFKNIVDHGIEVTYDRVDSGKSEYGEIACHIEKNEDQFVLDISDDGKGINVDTLRKKAVEKGIYTEREANMLSNERVLETIFLDTFSTKDEVDMISGRGVGLAAVRSEVEQLGGRIKVETEVGKFTRFQFVVPIPLLSSVEKHSS